MRRRAPRDHVVGEARRRRGGARVDAGGDCGEKSGSQHLKVRRSRNPTPRRRAVSSPRPDRYRSPGPPASVRVLSFGALPAAVEADTGALDASAA